MNEIFLSSSMSSVNYIIAGAWCRHVVMYEHLCSYLNNVVILRCDIYLTLQYTELFVETPRLPILPSSKLKNEKKFTWKWQL